MELENANSLQREAFDAAMRCLKEKGIPLDTIESIWFQDGKVLELEMKDGTRRNL